MRKIFFITVLLFSTLIGATNAKAVDSKYSLTDEVWDIGYTSLQINPIIANYGNFETNTNERYRFRDFDNLLPNNILNDIVSISTEAHEAQIASFDGFNKMKNIEELYIEGGDFSDLRPLRYLDKIKYLGFYGENNNNLSDLENLKNLERLDYCTSEVDLKDMDKVALTDLRSLSSLSKLKSASIHTTGILSPVTISKKYNNYTLFQPVILSNQFKTNVSYSLGFKIDTEVEYVDDFSSTVNKQGLLKFNNIPTDATHLSIEANTNYNNFNYSGKIFIPIVWVD